MAATEVWCRRGEGTTPTGFGGMNEVATGNGWQPRRRQRRREGTVEMVPAQLWDGKGPLTARRRSGAGTVKGGCRLVSVGRRNAKSS
ncbi:hypothetical protein TIFTF001_020396 [Ficus carica]|uniref:Uncharacterized protein n=1 Tax=Ficus carica TaxID=3494 RepID=A0AA88AFZ2_FICCA|nr:hypothetical protein TIFTF001_020396 [Ficus carica]